MMDGPAWEGLLAATSVFQDINHIGSMAVSILFYLGLLVVALATVAYVVLGIRLVWLMERVKKSM